MIIMQRGPLEDHVGNDQQNNMDVIQLPLYLPWVQGMKIHGDCLH